MHLLSRFLHQPSKAFTCAQKQKGKRAKTDFLNLLKNQKQLAYKIIESFMKDQYLVWRRD